MRNARHCSFSCILLALVCTTLYSGCGSKPKGPKTVRAGGTVTHNGSPVADASVAFLGDGTNPPATAITDSAGKFALTTTTSGDGAVPGNYLVTVSKYEKAAAATPGGNSMEAAAKTAQGGASQAAPKSLLPERYLKAATSGLSYKVEEGKDNQFEIKLAD